VEYGLILDIVPSLAQLYLGRRMPEVRLSPLQCAILLAVGCQHRTFDQVAKELDAPASQLLALFNKAMHKLANHCRTLLEKEAEEEEEREAGGKPLKSLKSGEVMAGGKVIKESLQTEQKEQAKKVNKKLEAARQELLASLNSDFAVAPGEEEIRAALGGKAPPAGTVSVARKRGDGEGEDQDGGGGKKGKKPRH